MNTKLGIMLGLLNLGGGELLLIFFILMLPLVLGVIGLIIFLIVRASGKHGQSSSAPQPPVQPPPMDRTQVLPRKCPKCGAALKPDAPEGLCPACLLQQGIATEGGAPSGSPAFTPPSLAELARLFPQLEILETIGQGGMGAVYKARQPALDRFVALKILAPRTGGDLDFSGRFSREARALARLSHPNIVAVHDFGTVGQASSLSPSEQAAAKSETGRTPVLHYFIMEYVDGPNLRQVEQAGKLSPREALQIIPQICAALQFAHDEGIVHRDIKPENVLLDKKGRVKIADFGLAKILGQEADLRLTGARDVMGTPHYMAPEQVETPQEVDHRADIYSLGVVFYEMLTGELPLGKFDPPSHRVQIDVRLDDVVMRSLSKSPERRYQHVSEVRTDVETIAQTPSAIGAQPGAAASASATAPVVGDYQLNIGHCIARGWNLLKQNFWPLVAVNTFVVILLAFMGSFSLTLSSHWPGAHFGSVVSLIFSGPLLGGLYMYFLKLIRGERATMETLFSGFSGHFLQLFLGNFVGAVLVMLGFLCLILPGIYLATAWLFTLVLIIDKRLDFWPAMELSRQVITRHWWKFLGFAIVLFLMKLTGLLFCIIGFFIAGPIVHAAFLYAYEDIFGAKAGAVVPPSPKSSSGAGWKIALGTAAALVLVIVLAIGVAGVWHHGGLRHRVWRPDARAVQREFGRRLGRGASTAGNDNIAEPGEDIRAIVHIRRFTVYSPESPQLDYAATVPPGYTLQPTVQPPSMGGFVHAMANFQNPNETHVLWTMPAVSLPRLLKPGDFKPGQPPPQSPPPPKLDTWEQREAETKTIQTQLQNLQDQGPVTVELGKPTVLFCYTNGAGEVRQGFLELIRAESNQPAGASSPAPSDETGTNLPNATNASGPLPQEEMMRLIEERDAKLRQTPGPTAPPAAAPAPAPSAPQAPEAAPAPLPAPGAPPAAE